MAGAFQRSQGDIKPVLGIPDDLDVLAVISFGYPMQPIAKAKRIVKPFRRLPIADTSANRLNKKQSAAAQYHPMHRNDHHGISE